MLNRLADIKEMALAIAENSVQGIVVMDAMGYCLYANQAWTEITGFTVDDMKLRPVHDWVHHHYADARPYVPDECPIGSTLTSGKQEALRNHRDVFFRKNGTSFHVSCAASPIVVDNVPVLRILEIRDITGEVEMERRKDEFLAMLAHELRNPLAPIAAAAEMLQMGRLDEAGLKQSSAIIARQVDHLSGLINDLLEVSRVTAGLVELDKESQDMRAIIAEAIEQVRPLIKAKRHWIAINVSSGDAIVHGDRKRLVQVFANILGNSAKYTPEGGEITVSIDATSVIVQVVVTDNGIGMTAETCEHAFEVFSQAQRTPDRSQGGLGIGLALVRSLVSLHDGAVVAHSEGQGKGTTVTVSLPRISQSDSIALSEAREESLPIPLLGGLPLNVMVVEDREDAGEALAMLLRSMGHQVRLEFDPYKAMQAAQEGSYDLFLLDVGLPGMDGMELAQAIRRQPQHARSLLVAITGYGQIQDRDNALKAGFDHFLVKPAKLPRLTDILNSFHK